MPSVPPRLLDLKINMNKQTTPETDAKETPHIGFYSCATVPADLARKLERERDEAMEKYDILATEHMLAINKLCNERDEAREALMKIHNATCTLHTDSERSKIRCPICLERERDEASDTILKLTGHGIDLMDSNRALKRKCRKAIAALREAIQFRDKTLSGYDLEEWMKAAGLKEEYK
jgi:hypothetical protein